MKDWNRRSCDFGK